MSARDGGVHGGGGLRVVFVDAGYAGPELRYQYPPPRSNAVPPVAYAKVRREKILRKIVMEKAGVD